MGSLPDARIGRPREPHQRRVQRILQGQQHHTTLSTSPFLALDSVVRRQYLWPVEEDVCPDLVSCPCQCYTRYQE